MAAGSTPTYEYWVEVNPNEQRIHIRGAGDWVRNQEMETYFSQLFDEPVAAVYTHAMMSNAKRLNSNGVEFFQENFYVIKKNLKVIRFSASLDLGITTSTDKHF